MELKLVVLAGAKDGTQIPLKKDKFLIGRAPECTLRAGSSAISRRHSAIVRTDGQWMVRDLGSRNGTFLNDTAVEAPTALSVGDELRVGPLKFRVEEYVKSASDSKPKDDSQPKVEPAVASEAAAPGSQDINRAKQPPAKDMAEVAKRTASHANSSEDDISRWLLGIEGGGANEHMLKETQTLSMEETTTISRSAPNKATVAANAPAAPAAELAEVAADEPATANPATEEEKAGSGGWSLFKKGKGKVDKKSPGKLPPRPAEQSKDSREAAADILREMTRRR